MHRHRFIVILAAALTPLALAQSGPTNALTTAARNTQQSGTQAGTAGPAVEARGNGTTLPGGAAIVAELTKSLDAKKAKAGDPVAAKTTQDLLSNGQVVIRRGSKLLGHVTEAQARTKENPESRLGIIFDRVTLKDGSEVALNADIQALAPPLIMPMSGGDMPGGAPTMPRQSPMGGGMMGPGATPQSNPTMGSTPPQPTSPNAGATEGNQGASAGTLGSGSHGVIGMKGLTLTSPASGSGQGSVISSDKENVKLDSGTQIVLRTASPAQH